MKDCCDTDQHTTHDNDHADTQQHISLLIGLVILICVLILDYGFQIKLNKWTSLAVNGIAYLLAGWGLLVLAFKKPIRGDIFNEFVLMSVATLGAFYIGEHAEGVAVMVFYSIGEWFQDSAVDRAKASIKALLDVRPDKITVI